MNKNNWWARRDSNPGPSPCQGGHSPIGDGATGDFFREFEQALRVDMRLAERTVRQHVRFARRLVDFLGKHPLEATKGDLRNFLEKNPQHYAVKMVRVIYGRFFGTDLAQSFKVPQTPFRPKRVPTKEQLRQFYAALEAPQERALFLTYATTGLRRGEVLSLTIGDIDLERRIVIPNVASSTSKRRWTSCFNQETEQALREYLNGRDGADTGARLFLISDRKEKQMFKRGSEAANFKIGPQLLRDWFCSEMGELGVADRYVDAFCGRVPRSVLARHYTDFSPERLKRIYDGAGLRVLA